MKKTRSTTLRRAWPSSDFSDRASDRMRSRSEKDYRLHKHFPPAFISQASRGYMTSANSWLMNSPDCCKVTRMMHPIQERHGDISSGDVSPISMSPITQSQFIPLGEILCLAISAMNSARKQVTQEALMEHLTTCFPGVPTPSPEILRHTLNMLVRERKIYPTPDGYFIVTPQTYFITPSLIRTNSKWYHLDERIPDRSQCTSPQQGTITPSTSGCVRDRTLPKNHCDSCHCCREDMHSMHASTLQRKSAKDWEAPTPRSIGATAIHRIEDQGMSGPRQQETAGNQEASFDYYNVSDDDDSEEGNNKNAEEEKNRDDVGTMQWLLEREKERDLQRKFEKNLTLLTPKETENSNNQRATHSARLDSMDSSSITVDSGFNSPRTRESLASNTSSIVESNRRQNPALSPAHGGAGPTFNFRATADPPTSEAEKLQKPVANFILKNATDV
uniref:Storkhead box 2 n=1 Tax=Ficedula albicollis TaxID=59894 RepID=A0A803VTJ2_FICAL